MAALFSVSGIITPRLAILDISCEVPGHNLYGGVSRGVLSIRGAHHALDSNQIIIYSGSRQGQWLVDLSSRGIKGPFRFYFDSGKKKSDFVSIMLVIAQDGPCLAQGIGSGGGCV